jgi:hypothetical protein
MTIRASELISRALALADLTNTSFPTAEENRTYINLAFADVYQEVINEGQKYWFETIEMPRTHSVTHLVDNPNYDPNETIPNPDYDPEDPESPETIPNPSYDPREKIPVTHTVTDMTLPDDFYQLYDLKDEKEQRIPRKQRNSIKNEKWYDIVKNELKVSERVEGKLTMEYFPKPFELDPSETGDVDLDFPDNIFYQICTLKLAEYYKIKQSGDISGIELLLKEAWNTYRNILNRDLDQPVTIVDIYENYRRII